MKKTTIETAIERLREIYGVEGILNLVDENQEIVRVLTALSLHSERLEEYAFHDPYAEQKWNAEGMTRLMGSYEHNRQHRLKKAVEDIQEQAFSAEAISETAFRLKEVNALLIAVALHIRDLEHIENPKAA